MKFSVVIENAKKIIKSKGLKQKYVAKRANFSECQFSDLLNGRKKIDDNGNYRFNPNLHRGTWLDPVIDELFNNGALSESELNNILTGLKVSPEEIGHVASYSSSFR